MVDTIDLKGKMVLDPSAGSGNILNYCASMGAKTYACEINTKLQPMLKGHEVIAADFLTVNKEDVSHIELIVMNPPFSQQEKHILHAWEVAPEGCKIISLCNAEMIRNQHTKDRRIIDKLIKSNGWYQDWGNVFDDEEAERKTDVEVGFFEITKPIVSGGDEFADYFSMEEDEIEQNGEGVVSYNFVRDAVNRYVEAVKKWDSVMTMNNEINSLTKGIGGGNIIFGAFNKQSNYWHEVTREEFKKDLQKAAWKWVFSQFKMDNYVTTDVMAQVNKMVETQTHVPFTMRNVYRLIEAVIGTTPERMKQVVLNTFDTVCKYSADNVTMIDDVKETWKTNSNYMLNKKFILPYMVKENSFHYFMVEIVYSRRSLLDDITKVLCFLTGEKWEKEKHAAYNLDKMDWEFGKWYEFTFFKCKCFHKGTMHLEFLDEAVWARFNQVVAELRGYSLPKQTKSRPKKRRKEEI